jgi:hypothetical protein
MKILRSFLVLGIGAAFAIGASGCAPTLNLEPGPDANTPGCAEVVVRLPTQLGELPLRNTNAQATGAWGEPASVILRCGIEPVEVSALPCVTVADVDWLVDDSAAPSFRFVTFGRTPATEVIVDSGKASGITALEELADAVNRAEPEKVCQG